MPIIEWNESYAVGISQFDDHHEHLIELLNKTYDIFIAQEPAMQMNRVLNELVAYSVYHFDAEECWMRQRRFPSLDEHARQHADFCREMAAFQHELLQGRALVTAGILMYLKDWLVSHILDADAEFCRFEANPQRSSAR